MCMYVYKIGLGTPDTDAADIVKVEIYERYLSLMVLGEDVNLECHVTRERGNR